MTDNEALEILNEMVPYLELIMSQRKARAIIHAAARLEEHNTGWIPVAERLPQSRKDLVVVCRKGGGVAISCYAPGKWIYGAQDVEYWMPIPALPESEDKNANS